MNSPEIFWYSRKNVRNLQTMNAVVFVHLWVTVFVFIFFVIDPGLSMYANLATYGVFLAITGWAVVTRHRRLLKQYGNQMSF